MRKPAIGVVSALALILSGCTAVRNELHHPGGYSGHLLDNRMLDASQSKRAAVLRQALLISMIARAGTVYARQGSENVVYVDALADAAEEINIQAGYVFANGTEGKACDMMGNVLGEAAGNKAQFADCTSFAANFESDTPQIERKVFQLIVLALPQDAARKFLSSLKGGSVLSAGWSAIKLVFVAANGLHNAAAENRTSIEMQAAAANTDACGKYLDNPDATVTRAMACLHISQKSAFAKPKTPLRLGDNDQTRLVFTAVMQNIRESCKMVTNSLRLRLPGDPQSSAGGAADPVLTKMDKQCNSIEFKPRPRFPNPSPKDKGNTGQPATVPQSPDTSSTDPHS